MEFSKKYATNTNTGRLISKSTALYRKLYKLGQVADLEIPATAPLPAPTPTPITPEPAQNPTPEPAQNPRVQLIELATDILAENKKKFVNLDQADTDELLRRLLFQKLGLLPTAKNVKFIEPPFKPKNARAKYVVSDSDESSDSDSD